MGDLFVGEKFVGEVRSAGAERVDVGKILGGEAPCGVFGREVEVVVEVLFDGCDEVGGAVGCAAESGGVVVAGMVDGGGRNGEELDVRHVGELGSQAVPLAFAGAKAEHALVMFLPVAWRVGEEGVEDGLGGIGEGVVESRVCRDRPQALTQGADGGGLVGAKDVAGGGAAHCGRGFGGKKLVDLVGVAEDEIGGICARARFLPFSEELTSGFLSAFGFALPFGFETLLLGYESVGLFQGIFDGANGIRIGNKSEILEVGVFCSARDRESHVVMRLEFRRFGGRGGRWRAAGDIGVYGWLPGGEKFAVEICVPEDGGGVFGVGGFQVGGAGPDVRVGVG